MTQPKIFELRRLLKQIKLPKLGEICPKDRCYYTDGTFYIIYKDDNKTYPSVGEIDGYWSDYYKRTMIKCYLSNRDTLRFVENILFPNIEKRYDFANLVEELSKLHDTKNKKIEEVKIEYDKIEDLYKRYKEILIPSCTLYKFCYYWSGLVISLDFRYYNGIPTVIHRSLMVKDTLAYLREQLKREDYGKAWDDVKKRVEPHEMISNIEYVPVRPYDKVNKNGETISVPAHGRLNVSKE